PHQPMAAASQESSAKPQLGRTRFGADTPRRWGSTNPKQAIVEDDNSSRGVLKGIRGFTDPGVSRPQRRTRPSGPQEPQPVSTRATPMTMSPMPISARRVRGSFQITRESRQTRATPQAAHSP